MLKLKKEKLRNHFKKNLIKKNLKKNNNLKFNLLLIYFSYPIYIKLEKFYKIYKYIIYLLNLNYKNIKIIYNINKYVRNITKRVKDSRMGGGKGDLIDWLLFFKKNSILFKIKIDNYNYNFIKNFIILLKNINLKLNKCFKIMININK